jgi:hypothetical protein
VESVAVVEVRDEAPFYTTDFFASGVETGLLFVIHRMNQTSGALERSSNPSTIGPEFMAPGSSLEC